MSALLFVYGTLRKAHDGSLHPFLHKQAEFIDNACVPGKLYRISTYPGAVLLPAGGGHWIHGELYRLLRPRLTLQQLDDYEECANGFPLPHEYRREQISVTLANNTHPQAWAYLYQHATYDLQRIDTGDYRPYLPASHYTA